MTTTSFSARRRQLRAGEVRLWPKRRRWPANGPKSAGSLLLRLPAPPGEHHRHCTAGEIASELGYSVSYVLAVKKAMYPNEATRPRRLDPVEVSEWIYAHPSFRMRDVYECHSKDDPRQEHLAFEGV